MENVRVIHIDKDIMEFQQWSGICTSKKRNQFT